MPRVGEAFSPDSRDLEDVPLDGRIKLGEIHADVDYVAALHLADVPQVDLTGKRHIT